MTAPVVTVCICTRNRAPQLRDVLEDLAAAVPSPSAWDVLVVDNGSTDDTAGVAASFTGRLPLRVVREDRAGLSVARNRGCARAAGEWVVFVDDDVRLDPAFPPAWTDALRDAERFGWAGGRIVPRWVGRPPRWFRDERLPMVAEAVNRHDLGPERRPYGPGDPPPIGCNFAVRREAFARVGPFRESLGVSGERRGLGEETDWVVRAQALGVEGLYVGDAVAAHLVSADRLSLRSLWRRGIQSGIAHAAIHGTPSRGAAWPRAGLHLVRGVGQWVRLRPDRLRQCVINAGVEVGLRRGKP